MTTEETTAASGVSPGSLLGRAALLGPVAALVVTGFVFVQHELQLLLWEHLPERLGFAEVPWWWAVGVLVAGALLVAAALRLPGGGGHSPLDGFAFDIGPRQVGSVVAAALASLSFGAVLGPEAPALAIGTALGYLAATLGARDTPAEARTLLMMAGGTAAFGAVLGNPLAIAMFVLEAALLSRRQVQPVLLVSVAVALAGGYVVQVGLGPWSGLGEVALSLPGLEPYPNVLVVDLLVAVPLSVVVALVVVAARHGGLAVRPWARRQPLAALVAAALVTAALALGVRAATGAPLDAVLFSGQAAMGDVLTATSAGTLLLVVAAKSLAYAACLGSGFRGGPIFPALFLAVAVAVAASLLLGSAEATGLVAAAVAAAGAAGFRMPFTAALLAYLLTAPAGNAVVTPALVGAVVGLLTVLALDRRQGAAAVPPSEQAVSP